MRHTPRFPGRFLATGLLIAAGLSSFGCGDSATVNPVVELATLSVDPGTLEPAFSGGTTRYNVELSSNITSVTINAQAAVAGDRVTINGQATTNSVVSLGAAGTTTPVSIVVSESDTSSRTYTVLFVRAGLTGNNSLQNIAVSSGTLDPAFDANIQDYTVDVANNVGSIDVIPTLSDPAATMTVNGQDTDSGQTRSITLNPAGQSTLITTVVTAQNSSTKSYRVTVSRGVSANSNLRALTISPGGLSFNANVTSYTVKVGSSVTNVTVRPTLADTSATMTVNNQATNSGQTRTIQLGTPNSSTPIIIVVTAQNGTQKTYAVTVERDALGGNNNLSALTVRLGTSGPNLISFSSNTTSYTVDVASTVTSIRVTPTLDDTAATLTVTSNGPGPITTSGQARTIPLRDAGFSTTITILVTAPNGSQKPYTIIVDRASPPPPSGNNNLSALTVRLGTSGPNLISFSSNTTSYTVDVASTVTSIRVTPTLDDTAATLTVTSNGPGPITTSGQARTIPLRDAGLITTITILVRAPNSSEKPYTVNVDRATPPPPSGNNNLQNLIVSLGTLAPSFDANRVETDYAVNGVSSSATSITVTATPQDSSATVEINQQAGNSRSIPLPTGPSNTEIEVRVIAPNGDDKTYSITVTQPAPAAPPATPVSAPDLINGDDSCPLLDPPDPNNPDPDGCVPGTSKSDHATNVTTPRFTVAEPPAGTTPKLYIDGVKDNDSTFSQGMLRPSAPLSDGNHSITYTLTNAGGESGESPPMAPQLRIIATPPPPPAP
ncbi:MAG: cadherin-like beta sandwich domain-containing protein [Nitrospira sp.]|nr:cadherin-like beta sandwich domain-containing protein [Nitrospira sp.]